MPTAKAKKAARRKAAPRGTPARTPGRSRPVSSKKPIAKRPGKKKPAPPTAPKRSKKRPTPPARSPAKPPATKPIRKPAKPERRPKRVNGDREWLVKRFAQANLLYTQEKIKRRRIARDLRRSPAEKAKLRVEDYDAWKDAGKRGSFKRYQANREGWRTRRHEGKLLALDAQRREIFGYTRDGVEVTPRYLEPHGSNRADREAMAAMIREGDERFVEYMEAAEEMDIGRDEAMDGWFSPEV